MISTIMVLHGSDCGFGRPADRLANNGLTYVVYPLTLGDACQATLAEHKAGKPPLEII